MDESSSWSEHWRDETEEVREEAMSQTMLSERRVNN